MADRSLTPDEVERQVQQKPADWRFIDLEGRKIAKITVGRYCGKCNAGSRWECFCECGRLYITSYAVLTNPITKSCGCHRDATRGHGSITHGMTASTEYGIWCGIKDRCLNKSDAAYHNYGGRGITICPEWAASFEAFYSHVGPRPGTQYTIDRFPDNNGSYEPGNVRWATRKEQANNTRANRIITVGDTTMTLMQWGEHTGLGWAVIKSRLDRGFDAATAVSSPLSTQGRRGSSPLGYVGISRSKSRFRARIRANGKNVNIGTFATAEEAGKAYLKAEAELGIAHGIRGHCVQPAK